ncbi:uncharacterized protein ppk24 [Eurosta solidaginis]|uniref:uncharacterized protein ppk24 n=1 Tax=Eurosta solidaginis TaxID=178769 RepID=UPI00353086F1
MTFLYVLQPNYRIYHSSNTTNLFQLITCPTHAYSHSSEKQSSSKDAHTMGRIPPAFTLVPSKRQPRRVIYDSLSDAGGGGKNVANNVHKGSSVTDGGGGGVGAAGVRTGMPKCENKTYKSIFITHTLCVLSCSTEDYTDFQKFLDTYDTFDNETFINTRRIAEMLSATCKNFIRKCKLGGREIYCFDRTVFQDSWTTYGLCCAFNKGYYYAKRRFRDRFVGPDLGLKVVLNTSHKDEFMSILNIDGYIVIVHDSDTYPDPSSVESQELYLSSGEGSSVLLRAFLISTEPSLRSFSPQTDEFPKNGVFRTKPYSFSDCITHFLMRSMLALCHCIPFYVVSSFCGDQEGLIFCTLQHVFVWYLTILLVRYSMVFSVKWNNALKEREAVPGLERYYEEALYCPECLPSCNDIQSGISVASLPIDLFTTTATPDELKYIGLHSKDVSVLSVFFDDPYSKKYKRLLGNTWYEALCTVGNVTSIFLGFLILAEKKKREGHRRGNEALHVSLNI